MTDCKCLNVDDVLRNLLTRVTKKEIARIGGMPDDDYHPSDETLRSVLWTIHHYREEMAALQKDVRLVQES